MKDTKPLEFITVEVEGQKHKVYRAELLEAPQIADILTNYDRATEEARDAEYELRKIAHARRSMTQELQQVVGQYVMNKLAAEKKTEEGDDDE